MGVPVREAYPLADEWHRTPGARTSGRTSTRASQTRGSIRSEEQPTRADPASSIRRRPFSSLQRTQLRATRERHY